MRSCLSTWQSCTMQQTASENSRQSPLRSAPLLSTGSLPSGLTPREEVSDAIRSWRGLGDDKRFAVSSCALRLRMSFLHGETHEMPTANQPMTTSRAGAQQRQDRDWAAWAFTDMRACRTRTRCAGKEHGWEARKGQNRRLTLA
jgi:hypothetical protein